MFILPTIQLTACKPFEIDCNPLTFCWFGFCALKATKMRMHPPFLSLPVSVHIDCSLFCSLALRLVSAGPSAPRGSLSFSWLSVPRDEDPDVDLDLRLPPPRRFRLSPYVFICFSCLCECCCPRLCLWDLSSLKVPMVEKRLLSDTLVCSVVLMSPCSSLTTS